MTDSIGEHVRKRLLQRFGIFITAEQLLELDRILGSGEAESIRGIRHAGSKKGVSKWEITLQGKTFVVLYRKKLHRIVTVYYPEWLQ